MYTVYVLVNDKKRLYIGMTNSLKRRLKEHYSGRCRSTKGFRPYRLVFSENYSTREEARKKEKYLKSGFGREYLKLLIRSRGGEVVISRGS